MHDKYDTHAEYDVRDAHSERKMHNECKSYKRKKRVFDRKTGHESRDPGTVWIPYQESGAFQVQDPDNKTISRNPEHAIPQDMSSCPTAFTHATPKDVFNYMLESTGRFHENYHDVLKAIRDLEFNCHSVLCLRALEVLCSGDYSREKYENSLHILESLAYNYI